MKDTNYMEKVKGNGMALKNVPYKRRTAEVCLAAVCKDYKAIRFVPDELRAAVIEKSELTYRDGEE
jgi:hypothetical protein